MVSHFSDNEKRTKALLRQHLRACRRKTPPNPACQAPLLASDAWRRAAAVGLYQALPEEAPTAMLLENAWQTGKTVFLPKITDKTAGEMEFMACAGLRELRPGPFGLLEPAGGAAARSVDLLVLPGLAFDRKGWRLGYGGGYYDRFLARRKGFAPLLAGLCQDCQILDSLPHAAFDMPVNGLCTESGLLWI